jgi:hypothetical protein
VLWLTWPLAPSCADHLPDPVGLLGFWGWTYLFDLEFTAWALAWDVHALWEAPANFFQATSFIPPRIRSRSRTTSSACALRRAGVPRVRQRGVWPERRASRRLPRLRPRHARARGALDGSHGAAFGAGLVYASNVADAPSFSLQVVGAPYLPLVVLFFERWTERERWRDLAACVGCVVLQTLASYYLGYAAFIVLRPDARRFGAAAKDRTARYLARAGGAHSPSRWLSSRG